MQTAHANNSSAISQFLLAVQIHRSHILAFTLLSIGFFLRLNQYLFNRSLWLDEAFLTFNILNASFYDLTKPLEYAQAAPILFLWTEKLFVTLFGNSEYVLRLFPLIVSCLGLILIFIVSKNLFASSGVALLMLALLTFNRSFIYYASEVKQYSNDVFVGLILILLFNQVQKRTVLRREVFLLGVAGSVAIWFSHPVLFILACVGLSLFLQAYREKNREMIHRLLLVALSWVGSFIIFYMVSLNSTRQNQDLIDFWKSSFMPLPPWSNWNWFIESFDRLFQSPVGFSLPFPISVVLLLIGAVYLIKQKFYWSIVVIGPIFLALIASGFKLYPFGDRLMLFSVPLFYILLTSGLVWIAQYIKKGWLLILFWLSMSLFLLNSPVQSAWGNMLRPINVENIRPVVEYMSKNKLDTDPIYLYYAAVPAFQYYGPKFGISQNPIIYGVSQVRQTPEKYLEDVRKLSGRGRVWFVFSHYHQGPSGWENELMLEELRKYGTLLDQKVEDGASCYLFDLNR